MQSLLWQADSIANSVYLDDLGGRVSWGDARDIVDVSAVALTSDGHERKTYGLTDEHALNGERIGAQLNEVTTRNHPPKGYLAGIETAAQDILSRPARTFANFITDNSTSFSR